MALIVTIIVLLILAGVSIATLAGNNGLISRTTIAKEATRAGEVKELVRLEAQANRIAEATNDTNYTQKTRSAVITELVADGKLTSAEAEEIQSAENPTITIGGITIDFSILPEAQITTQWALQEGDTSLSVGDLLTPTVTGLESEKFYVIGIDGTGDNQTVRLLAQYCVDTTSSVNAQNSSMGISDGTSSGTVNGGIQFASNTNSYDNSSIRTFVEAYANRLVTGGLSLEDVETVEGESAISGVKGRLMWGTNSSGEVQNAISINSNMVKKPDSTNNIFYWLGSPVEGMTEDVYYICPAGPPPGVQYQKCSNAVAVRPVIKILASKIGSNE